METWQMTPLSFAKMKWMQFVLMMPALGFCFMYDRSGTVQKINLKNHVYLLLYLENGTFL